MKIKNIQNTVIQGDNALLKEALSNGSFKNRLSTKFTRDLLIHAVEHCNTEAVRLLVEYGVSSNVISATGSTLLHFVNDAETMEFLISRGWDFNLRNYSRDCAIHLCAEKGLADCVRLLVEAGAMIDIVSSDGSTPLMLAAKSKAPGAAKTVETLIQLGCRTDIVTENKTALHWAIVEDNQEPVKVMLDHGVSMIDNDFSRLSPMYYAIQNGATAVVDMLINHGADLQEKSTKYGTPLHLACRMRTLNFDIIRRLVIAGADTDAFDSDRYKPDYYFKTLDDRDQVESKYEGFIRERIAHAATDSFEFSGSTRSVRRI